MMNALALAVLVACQAPKPDPTDKWKLELKLTYREQDGRHVFGVEGTTDLPADAVLRARIYAVEIVDAFQGKREDEEPLVWEEDEGQAPHKSFSPEGGRFKHDVYSFVRKPYALLYRARVHYIPRDQNAAVFQKVGGDDFSRHADLKIGGDVEYKEQLVERVREITEDLVEIERLYEQLDAELQRQLKKADPDAWRKFKDPWFTQVEKINERNKERYNLWAVWVERQAKMRVNGMCELLRRILVAGTEKFVDGQDTLQRLQQMHTGFLEYFEEAIEVMGLNIPLKAGKVGPILQAYEKALAPVRAWVENPGANPDALRRRALREGNVALQDLTPLLKVRKRGYLYVNEISLRFTRLLELVGALSTPDELRAALKEHDSALAEFRKFAGLQ